MTKIEKKQRRTALITGASAGIGRDYARYLAARNFDLVLTARRTDRLEAIAQELKAAFGTKVTVLTADLVEPDAPKKLAASLKQSKINIDYLVNNAGYAVPGMFQDASWQAQSEMIQVMMTAVTEFCHIFAPQMAARRYGRIVNVASVAAFLPGTKGGTLYSPVKAYVMRLSQSLALEYKEHGVHVISLCPGFTWSEFHDVAGNRGAMNKMPNFVWLEGPRVVDDAHLAVEKGKGPVVVNGLIYRALVGFLKIMPENLMTRLSGRGKRNRVAKPSDQKPAAKKPAVKKPAAKKPATKKPATKKPAAKKPEMKKPVAKKSATKKPATQKPAAKK